jgi:glutathione peroxidase
LTKKNYITLAEMCRDYSGKCFEVMAFPCNQFGKQEPGSPKEIKSFIRDKYECKFPIFEKIEVNGDKAHPIYQYLRSNSSLYNKDKKEADVIPWNFAKFLVNNKGQVVKYFTPKDDFSDVKKAVE